MLDMHEVIGSSPIIPTKDPLHTTGLYHIFARIIKLVQRPPVLKRIYEYFM